MRRLIIIYAGLEMFAWQRLNNVIVVTVADISATLMY